MDVVVVVVVKSEQSEQSDEGVSSTYNLAAYGKVAHL